MIKNISDLLQNLLDCSNDIEVLEYEKEFTKDLLNTPNEKQKNLIKELTKKLNNYCENI